MKLCDLFPSEAFENGDLAVKGLTADSRLVRKDYVFFAVGGVQRDGSDFIDDAIKAGAIAIVQEGKVRETSIPSIPSQDIRHDLALAAARFYPRQPDTIVAVTGTSGKTSVADFTRQIFDHCGRQAASLGTIGVVRSNGISYGALTTPDPVTLHASLHTLADEGVTHLAMEASSHGIDQRRLDGVHLNAAAFTNLGHDHLDYHGTREAYLAAKLRLFDTLLPSDGIAVVNADIPESVDVMRTAERRGIRVLSVGQNGSDLCLIGTKRQGFDQSLTLEWRGKGYPVLLPLAGEFQASNALVAAGLALSVGEAPDHVFEALGSLQGVKGRLERVATYRGGLILVDYAHKPEALEQALLALRPFVTGKLICVFGCGGDRDRAKRPLMGTVAYQNADIVIVTDDNPRSEVPALIRQAILAACPGARDMGDRFEAIKAGIAMISEGDVLLIAGKGHETGQIFGDYTLPFSDHEAVASVLAEGQL
jgi:UDP-N-acetylmuramoyl-L-alanyl-D-glutamate--2,6-diaminopimelate ligase